MTVVVIFVGITSINNVANSQTYKEMWQAFLSGIGIMLMSIAVANFPPR